MRKYLLLLLVLALSFTTAFAADENKIIIKTSKPVGTTVTLDAYTASKDEAFTVDWGDGEEKTYNLDPNGWGYSRRINAEIKGGVLSPSRESWCILTLPRLESHPSPFTDRQP